MCACCLWCCVVWVFVCVVLVRVGLCGGGVLAVVGVVGWYYVHLGEYL